jgi:hypothetical protein
LWDVGFWVASFLQGLCGNLEIIFGVGGLKNKQQQLQKQEQ